jgi:adenylate cyclase
MRHWTVVRVSGAIALMVALLRLLSLAYPRLMAPLELLDMKALDLRHILRGSLAPGGQVVIIGIDQKSLDEVGRWPWQRARLATLIDRLSDAGTAAIGLDVILEQPDASVDVDALREIVKAAPPRSAEDLVRVLGQVDGDARLAEALRASGRVVLGHFFEFGGGQADFSPEDVERIPELSVRSVAGGRPRALEQPTRLHLTTPRLAAAAAGAGHINFFPDGDGVYRRAPLAIAVGERVVPALSVELLRRGLGGVSAMLRVTPAGVESLRIGDREFALAGSGELWVNYLGRPRTMLHVSAADVLAGTAPRESLAGRIAIVGFTATGFDEIPTPFIARAPGVELQATVVDNMLRGMSLRRPWWIVPGEAAVVIAIGLLLGVVLHRVRGVVGLAFTAALVLGYAAGTQYLFTRQMIAVGGVYPLLGISLCTLGIYLYQAVSEEQEKRKIRHAFRHYVNPEVTDLIASHPERLRLGGERRELTILFSDIRGFTGISEVLKPEELGELLNEYLGGMTDILFRHGGLLDKYIGDAVMAFWGAPVTIPDHAARCCKAALDMQAKLGSVRAHWKDRGVSYFEIGIGIHTGDAVVGNFGAAQRFNYTAMGDSVNLASRLEGLNKTYGTRMLVSESTRRAVGDEFVCREIDWVRVKGRQAPVAVHELLGRRVDDAGGRLARLAKDFDAAVAAYRAQRWDDALERLGALAEAHPEDHAVPNLAERCRAQRTEPPGAGWDGVYEAKTK